jgi:hypothetical protein
MFWDANQAPRYDTPYVYYMKLRPDANAITAPKESIVSAPAVSGPSVFRSEMRLRLVAPNPLAADADVEDVCGRLVRRLSRGAFSGSCLVWDGRDEAGRRMAAGVYFVRVTAGRGAVRLKVVKLE